MRGVGDAQHRRDFIAACNDGRVGGAAADFRDDTQHLASVQRCGVGGQHIMGNHYHLARKLGEVLFRLAAEYAQQTIAYICEICATGGNEGVGSGG